MVLEIALGFLTAVVIKIIVRRIVINRLFHKVEPFVRQCNRCGAIQRWQNDIYGGVEVKWWEQILPGNPRDCKCKNYTKKY